MREYTSNELKRMQDESINRVKEMRKHSQYVIDSVNKELEAGINGAKHLPGQVPFGGHIEKHEANEENTGAPDIGRLKIKAPDILKNFNFENDHWLILAIIVLLWSEKADIGIILALFYIGFF
ncbi:MAG: hypothetical protein FWF08_05055 [Oscillospiraceae bacterium]|nr:hypothetical protein [Oscillospiraceae bacterium]